VPRHAAPPLRDADEARAWRTALLVTAAATLVRLLLAAQLPLFPDETYYWEWSRRLAGGYFDHPPMIAVLIKIGAALHSGLVASPPPFFIRLAPVLAGGVASLAAVAGARRIGGGRAARIAAWVFALIPLAATGLVLATPDAPLLAASACGVYAVVRALQAPPRSRESFLWWCAAGVALGLAFTSKYTSILLPLSITAAVLLRPALRTRLREPGPYVACVLAILVFLPVLRWNAAHDWISFRFQLAHGLGAPTGSALKRELDLLGGQLGLVSPILFALMAHAVWRTLRRPIDDVHFMLAVVAVGCWVFFVYSARRRSVEANWPAPSYVPGAMLLASLAARSFVSQRWVRYGIALAAVMVALIYAHAIHPILPLPPRRDPVARSTGWEHMVGRVDSTRGALVASGGGSAPYLLRDGGVIWIGADRYQDVSELAYHMFGQPDVFCMCLTGRHNQYELWPTFPQRAQPGDALILALDETPDVHGTAARLAPYFTTVTRGAPSPLLRGNDTIGVRRVWILEGYRGGWPRRAER
jgi:4-amino-4-deoxy-L-arabinose transferase-like glycosyltransferase